jgi:hypothetical protein
MMRWLDKLNLPPTERRWVLGGLVVLLVVLNYWFIWPYFGEWGKVSKELGELNRQAKARMTEIGKKAEYERKLNDLQKSGGGIVLQEDQANRVQQTIYTQGSANGVTVNSVRPVSVPARLASGQTNQFFDEVRMTVDLVAGEQELVNFLYALGSGDSSIRVSDMVNLRLDPSQTKLITTLTLVASFQKKAPAPATSHASAPTRGAITTNKTGQPVVQPKGPPKGTSKSAATNAVSTNRPPKK